MSTKGGVFSGSNAKRRVDGGGQAGRRGVRIADAWGRTGLAFFIFGHWFHASFNNELQYVLVVHLAWSHSSSGVQLDLCKHCLQEEQV